MLPGGVAIEARALSHAYPAPGGGRLEVLRALRIDVPATGYCTLAGPSGAGKSTLLSLIGGLEPVQAGNLRIDDLDISTLRRDDLAAYRRSTVGFVFQHFGLLDTLTALENVELAATLAGTRRRTRRRHAVELLEAVGLGDRADHRPPRLSGGERQRVAIARSLMNRPRLVLADEPTGNLDEASAIRVIELLEDLHRSWGFTLVVVTHNRTLAARGSMRVRLDRGSLAAA